MQQGNQVMHAIANPSIEPEYNLDRTGQAHLAQAVSMEGFKVLNHIMRSEVDKFVVDLLNADPADKDEVLSRHTIAKSAAQFYQAVINRVNEEVTQYTNAPTSSDKPLDVTAGVLDMGEIAAHFQDVPNFLGGEGTFE